MNRPQCGAVHQLTGSVCGLKSHKRDEHMSERPDLEYPMKFPDGAETEKLWASTFLCWPFDTPDQSEESNDDS